MRDEGEIIGFVPDKQYVHPDFDGKVVNTHVYLAEQTRTPPNDLNIPVSISRHIGISINNNVISIITVCI